jgi:hypothetical protein
MAPKLGLGDVVGEPHLSYEHVPPFTTRGPTIGWARRVHWLMVHSLCLPRQHVQRDPASRQVQACYADVPISARRPMAPIERAASRHGFDTVSRGRTLWRDVIKSLLLWCLADACYPAARIRRGVRASSSADLDQPIDTRPALRNWSAPTLSHTRLPAVSGSAPRGSASSPQASLVCDFRTFCRRHRIRSHLA